MADDAMMDAEQLRWRQLDWSLLPHTAREGAMPFLSMGDTVSLDNAVTNSEARPHLVKAYKGLESSGWTLKVEEDYSCRALEWVRERSINLRGFEMKVRSKDNGKLLKGALERSCIWKLSTRLLWGVHSVTLLLHRLTGSTSLHAALARLYHELSPDDPLLIGGLIGLCLAVEVHTQVDELHGGQLLRPLLGPPVRQGDAVLLEQVF